MVLIYCGLYYGRTVPLRRFIPLQSDATTTLPPNFNSENIRVLQFNILADGLAGLRSDKGKFSRLSENCDEIYWKYRRGNLLKEITQYDPDVITMQENDHFYDFFLPTLTARGYDGLFAPKPLSSCLDVSPNSDGCSIFVKRDRLRVCSAETLTFALSNAETSLEEKSEIEWNPKDLLKRTQNQVALITLCELCNKEGEPLIGPPPIIIGTTHLKAAKSASGERIRQGEVTQLLRTVNSLHDNFAQRDAEPVVVLTGDFNALPLGNYKYDSLTYKTIKSDKLNLKSVYNDDLNRQKGPISSNIQKNGNEVYTTWKARRRRDGGEKVVKHCIDYIFYGPKVPSGDSPGLGVSSILDIYSDSEVGKQLLPSKIYPSDHLALCANLMISWDKHD